MEPFAELIDARRGMRRYLAYAEGKLPQDTFDKLEALADSPSPVDAICKSAELLYARKEQLDDEGLALAGQLAAFAATNSWHGMADGNRGGLIMQAMRRDMGIEPEPGQTPPQPPEDDPVPVEAYVPPPAPEEGEAPEEQQP